MKRPCAPSANSSIAPDFFIIGAPKCGTSSLYEYLSMHSDIFLSSVKEPLYFCGKPLSVVGDFNAYLSLFAKAKPTQMVGEGSTLYLYLSAAVTRILDLNRDAKFIVMVRNPIDMTISYHNQTVYSFEQIHTDLRLAWNLSDDPVKAMDHNCHDPRLLDYKSICSLGMQLDRLKSIVDERCLHVVVFDDLCANPAATCKGVLSFLDLPFDGQIDFPVVNSRMEHRFTVLAKALLAPPPPLRHIRSSLKRCSPILAKRIGRYLLNLNRQPSSRKPLDPRLRADMVDHFAADIELLGKLLNRDLRPWLLGQPVPNRPAPPTSDLDDERLTGASSPARC